FGGFFGGGRACRKIQTLDFPIFTMPILASKKLIASAEYSFLFSIASGIKKLTRVGRVSGYLGVIGTYINLVFALLITLAYIANTN
ncbi:MAG: hypothetical protein RIA69_08415, partial [Cyclobacteriaceae bacterium]